MVTDNASDPVDDSDIRELCEGLEVYFFGEGGYDAVRTHHLFNCDVTNQRCFMLCSSRLTMREDSLKLYGKIARHVRSLRLRAKYVSHLVFYFY